MALRTQYEFLFVGRDEGSFVENYAYDLGEGGENSGKIFINLEIQNNPADAETIGEVIFDAVRKVFYADPEKEPYVRFEDAVKTVNKALLQMKEDKQSKYLGVIHAVIGAIAGNNLYITQCGEAEAYLIRRRLCSTISEGLSEEESTDMFTNIASGTLEPNDVVMMNSTRLLRYISKTDLAKICSGRNLVSSLGELKDFLATEVVAKVGVIGIAVAEAAAAFTENEKGKIVAHLEKEEVVSYSGKEAAGRTSVAALKKAVGRLSVVVNDLRKRVASAAPRSSGGVRRGSAGGSSAVAGTWTKDKILVAFIAAIVLLTLGVWWLRSRASEQQTIDNYATVLTEVREQVASAETTGQYNKDQAGQMLTQAEQKALEVLNSGYHRAKANELLQAIQESRDKLDGVVRPEARVLADLSEKRPNVSALGLLGMKGNLYAYEYNALYPIILDKVQDPLTIDESETVVSGTIYEDKESLLFYTKSGKVIEYKDDRMSFVDTAEGSFHKGVAVKGYSNKLYILDPEGNQIWRYTRRRDKFDAAEQYNVNADLKNGVSLAIDGNIYVLNNDGFITKLFSGNREDFPIKKQPIKELSNPTRIFTELDMSAIYILEPSERRVLQYYKDDKTGGATYNAQYVFDELTDLRDIYVDKDTNRMYLMDAGKVYSVNL